MKPSKILIPLCLFLSFAVVAQNSVGLPKAILVDKNGKTISTTSISDFDNPIVLVTYAKSWCSVCTSLLDELDKQYLKQADPGVKIYAISVENNLSNSEVFSYASRWKNIETLFDKNDEFMKAMRAEHAPKIFFMDANQRVVYCHEKPLDARTIFKLAGQIRRGEVIAAKTYFDKDWFPVPAAEGVYYRQVSRKSEGVWSVKDYYKNGTLQMEGEASLVYPLIKNGPYKYYWTNGKLSETNHFIQGQSDGKQTGYYENGKLEYEYTNKLGKADGPYTRYHANGKIATSGMYENGKPRGKWLYYYDNGAKRKEANYYGGVLDGRVVGWFANGKIRYDSKFSNGVLINSPMPKFEFENGRSAYELNREEGKAYIKYFYEDGSTRALYAQAGDQMELSIFLADGTIIAKAEMMDEETVHGKVIEWYNNGQKSYEAIFEYNEPVGKAIAWHKNGIVRERRDYTTGTHEFFDEKGNKISRPNTVRIAVNKGETIDASTLSAYARLIETSIINDGNTSE